VGFARHDMASTLTILAGTRARRRCRRFDSLKCVCFLWWGKCLCAQPVYGRWCAHSNVLTFTRLSSVTEGFELCRRSGQKLTLKPSFLRLADMIAQKRQHPYPTVMGWQSCRLSFASPRASIMCIRGSRSSFHRPIYGSDITLATYEGRISSV